MFILKKLRVTERGGAQEICITHMFYIQQYKCVYIYHIFRSIKYTAILRRECFCVPPFCCLTLTSHLIDRKKKKKKTKKKKMRKKTSERRNNNNSSNNNKEKENRRQRKKMQKINEGGGRRKKSKGKQKER